MEDRYKLSDPRTFNRDRGYVTLVPIGLIAWSQNSMQPSLPIMTGPLWLQNCQVPTLQQQSPA
jgi:hypothetical protein